ncbi:hypothetical protein [Lactobacillus sp.]|uniref:hypothetical protein n=1 Tax=Lactobacillus sp. TaxID=1591 RepID=UPI0019946671|nr:hypothetical protein [Lactobacillus sp.]MBD5429276.1 hypothetical protein [Lactobacillus sp.]
MLKNYKLTFDPWSLMLFLIIMIPNLIWFVIPAPNDILRINSTTEVLDTFSSIFQILMMITLCFFKNTKAEPIRCSPLIIATLLCCLLYFVSWILYYSSVANDLIIVSLATAPCLIFLLFDIDRKNWFALGPILLFSICHIISGLINLVFL